MAFDPAKSSPPSKARAIVQRTRARTHGPATRLMSPSDLGEILKPFAFLDLFDHEGAPFNGHPDLRRGRRGQQISTRTTSRAHCRPAASNGCTSPDALRDAEAHISAIRTRLVQEGTPRPGWESAPSISASRRCIAMIRRLPEAERRPTSQPRGCL
jgi:hypothetical protein